MSEQLDRLRAKYPGSNTFVFGDTQELCDWLLGLVRDGKKTATCTDVRDIESGKVAMPVVGRRDIALNWDGTPALVIETRDIEIVRFDDVSEAFALAEGENDSLDGWRRDHKAYFERNGGFDPQMKLLCERFALIEDVQP